MSDDERRTLLHAAYTAVGLPWLYARTGGRLSAATTDQWATCATLGAAWATVLVRLYTEIQPEWTRTLN